MIRIILIMAALFISACGPSKEEILRLQLLEQQRIAAELAAQREAEARELRIQQRSQEAHSAFKKNASLTAKQWQQLFNQPHDFKAEQIYFAKISLQAARYSYADKHQVFSIIGMRPVANQTPYATILANSKKSSFLELTLFSETELNRVNQEVAKEGGQRLAVAFDNIKKQPLLRGSNSQWRFDDALFHDLRWSVSPEQAWEVTSGRDAYVQVGLRICATPQCQVRYTYQSQPTLGLQADVISLLVIDGKSQQVLTEFVREAL